MSRIQIRTIRSVLSCTLATTAVAVIYQSICCQITDQYRSKPLWNICGKNVGGAGVESFPFSQQDFKYLNIYFKKNHSMHYFIFIWYDLRLATICSSGYIWQKKLCVRDEYFCMYGKMREAKSWERSSFLTSAERGLNLKSTL